MSAEDRRNSGLNLLLLLAQAYYKLLESAICVPCGAVDLDLNHSYLWTLKNIKSLLGNHPDLKDFPISFEPVFPNLFPASVLDYEWEDMVAPEAERFLSTVQEFVMTMGSYPPEEGSPACMFIELFKPGVEQAIKAGRDYRKRMKEHFGKILAQTVERAAPQAQSPDEGEAKQPKQEQMQEQSRKATSVAPKADAPVGTEECSMPGWKGLQINKPFEPRIMLWNGRRFFIEEPAICCKGFDLDNLSLEDYFPDLREDWDKHIRDVPFEEVENLRVLLLVGCEKTLSIHVMLKSSVVVYPDRLESSGDTDGWHEGGVVVVSGERYEVKGVRVEPTELKIRAKIKAAQRARAAVAGAERRIASRVSPRKCADKTPRTVRPGKAASQSPLDWVKQAELVRALNRVLGVGESPNKSTLTRAVQNGLIQSNGESARKLLLQVDSVKAWLTRTRGMDHGEVQQVVDAVMSEIRMRT
jgi:hypothetical protein